MAKESASVFIKRITGETNLQTAMEGLERYVRMSSAELATFRAFTLVYNVTGLKSIALQPNAFHEENEIIAAERALDDFKRQVLEPRKIQLAEERGERKAEEHLQEEEPLPPNPSIPTNK